MARAVGAVKNEPPRPSSNLPKTCRRCGFVNEASSKFCSQCAAPLALGELDSRAQTQRTVAGILTDSAVMQMIAERLVHKLRTERKAAA